MRQHFVFALVLGMLVIVPRLKGGPPDSTFKQATGRMYCGADWGKSGCHGAGAIKLPTDVGYTIDKSYHQGNIPCCGGNENNNGATVEVPAGVYIETVCGGDGECGVFDLKLVADSSDIDENGNVRAWTVTARDVYCGPSARVGAGGCNMNVYAWVKQKRISQ